MSTTLTPPATGRMVHDVHWDIDYKIHLGGVWSRFFATLRDEGRIVGNTCGSCDRTYVPPQAYCERCFEAIEEWKEVADVGTLHGATISYRDFKGGPKAPYAVGAILLDGADTLLMHFLGGVDLADQASAQETLRRGLRVQAVWAEQRTGAIMDIEHFRPVD